MFKLILICTAFLFFITLLLDTLLLNKITTPDPKNLGRNDMVLASDMKGQLVDRNGSPMAGLKVTRNVIWGWNDEEFLQETTADSEGRFSFEPVIKRSLLVTLLPHEPSGLQLFSVYRNGQKKEFLGLTNRFYKLDHEAAGLLKDPTTGEYEWIPHKLDLICDIDANQKDAIKLGLPFNGVCVERIHGPVTRFMEEKGYGDLEGKGYGIEKSKLEK